MSAVLKPKNNKGRMGRDVGGKFCKLYPGYKEHEPHTRRNRGKYFISSWTDNPVMREKRRNTLYVACEGRTLLQQGRELLTETAHADHHLAHSEHWLLLAGNEKRTHWRGLQRLLPSTLRHLLEECASICAHTPLMLYRELALVDTYISYVHLALTPTDEHVRHAVRNVALHW